MGKRPKVRVAQATDYRIMDSRRAILAHTYDHGAVMDEQRTTRTDPATWQALEEEANAVYRADIGAEREIDRLAKWLMANEADEIGRGGSESAVDVAIRLLSRRR